jgi:gamma-butyrobetaine dioxygenase
LRNKVLGGTSVFVDALHVASLFRETHPIDFDILSKTPVSFHYVNDGHHLHQDHFTIELGPPTLSSSLREISHVNYSPPFQAPLPLSTPKEFYPALKRFTDLLNDDKHTFEFSLEEGDAVLFDNRRVLHARTAFRSRTKEEWKTQSGERVENGEPDRWLKGCYLEADSLLDRLRVLKGRLASTKDSDMGVKFK